MLSLARKIAETSENLVRRLSLLKEDQMRPEVASKCEHNMSKSLEYLRQVELEVTQSVHVQTEVISEPKLFFSFFLSLLVSQLNVLLC